MSLIMVSTYFLGLEFSFEMTTLLFCSGLFGIVFSKKNFLVSLLSAELMYVGLIFGFSTLVCFANGLTSNSLSLLLLVIAASESAVGLGILIMTYRFRKSVNFTASNELRS